VECGIDADLDILRVAADLLDRYDERVKWLNFPGMVEEFSELLKDQLDLRSEARNLLMFRENFKGSKVSCCEEIQRTGWLRIYVHRCASTLLTFLPTPTHPTHLRTSSSQSSS
jgi:hypothetical protein